MAACKLAFADHIKAYMIKALTITVGAFSYFGETGEGNFFMTIQITANAKEIAALIKELQGQENANNNTQGVEQFFEELKEGLSSIFKI